MRAAQLLAQRRRDPGGCSHVVDALIIDGLQRAVRKDAEVQQEGANDEEEEVVAHQHYRQHAQPLVLPRRRCRLRGGAPGRGGAACAGVWVDRGFLIPGAGRTCSSKSSSMSLSADSSFESVSRRRDCRRGRK